MSTLSVRLVHDGWDSSLCQALHEFRVARILCDTCLLTADGHKLYAHACVLAAASPFFKLKIALSHKTDGCYGIRLDTVASASFEKILEFLYLGETRLSPEKLHSVYAAALSVEFAALLLACEKELAGDAEENDLCGSSAINRTRHGSGRLDSSCKLSGTRLKQTNFSSSHLGDSIITDVVSDIKPGIGHCESSTIAAQDSGSEERGLISADDIERDIASVASETDGAEMECPGQSHDCTEITQEEDGYDDISDVDGIACLTDQQTDMEILSGIDELTDLSVGVGNEAFNADQDQSSDRSGKAGQSSDRSWKADADSLSDTEPGSQSHELDHDSGVLEEEIQNEAKSEQPKRRRNPNKWISNVRKKLRNSGKAYINYKGKLVPERKYSFFECNCRLKCSEKLPAAEREEVFKEFWGMGSYDQQSLFITCSVLETDVKRRTAVATQGQYRRQNTRSYYLGGVHVCRQVFVKTLAITKTRINSTMSNKETSGTPAVDGRGRSTSRRGLPSDVLERVRNHIVENPIYQDRLGCNSNMKLNVQRMYQHYKTVSDQRGLKAVSSHTYYRLVKSIT